MVFFIFAFHGVKNHQYTLHVSACGELVWWKNIRKPCDFLYVCISWGEKSSVRITFFSIWGAGMMKKHKKTLWFSLFLHFMGVKNHQYTLRFSVFGELVWWKNIRKPCDFLYFCISWGQQSSVRITFFSIWGVGIMKKHKKTLWFSLFLHFMGSKNVKNDQCALRFSCFLFRKGKNHQYALRFKRSLYFWRPNVFPSNLGWRLGGGSHMYV